MALFGRHVILRIGPDGGTGREFEGFRIVFDVKMSRESSPNEAVIECYNLAAASVALAQEPTAVVEVLVGYDVPRLIFRGTPVKNGVRLDRRGPDRVLRIEAQDGGRTYAEGRIAVSFSTQSTITQVFDAISAQLGIPIGTVRLPEGVVFPRSLSLNGPARDVLDRLAEATASQWFIRDGALQFIEAGGDTGEQAVVFSASAGNLIGSPTPTDEGIEVRALLAPSLRPGKVFEVQSADYSGQYVAGDVQFRGDSGWDQPFYVIANGTAR